VCDGSCDADSLLQAADKAMYAAKGNGRGCYVIAGAPPWPMNSTHRQELQE
jgi:predicted signal transduction protein with EAL and GGDEF domain